MAVLHDWECMAHGHFEAKGSAEKPPKCPKGCSSSLVELIYLQPVRIGNARYKRGDRLVREAAEMQGLSDISTSPSRSGGSVAQRNRMRNRRSVLGPAGRPDLQYPGDAAAVGRAGKLKFGDYIGALTHKGNALTDTGFGHAYDKNEWKKDDKTGAVRHVAAQGPIVSIPTGSTGVSIERVKERPK